MSENDNNTVADFSMQCRLRAIPKQFLVLLKFMERHGDLSPAQSLGPRQRLESDRLWEELVMLLDTIEGGVKKSKDKWKKVWADWKTKTKKKALMLRRYPNGPKRYATGITSLEQRVLNVMGLGHAVVTPPDTKGESDDQPRESESPVVEEQSAIYIQTDSQLLDVEEIMFEMTPPYAAHSIEEAPEIQPVPVPHDAAQNSERISPNADHRQYTSPEGTSKAGGQKRRRLASPTASSSGPRRRALQKALKRVKTAFERRTKEFASVEHRRLRLEEIRERNEHERKTEKLRLESRRIDMEEQRNVIFSSIANTLADIFSQST